MIRILFICHGNICRSPMAEFILKDMVNNTDGINPSEFHIESAAVSREEIGNDIYPPAKAVLTMHGIPFEARRARQMTKNDYERFNVIFVMDESNVRRAMNILDGDPEHKIKLLIDRGISDPWYTGEFESTYRDIVEGCEAFLKSVCFNTEKQTS